VSNRNYKRSWKNLLINKQYQLRFTLIMVGLATLLMGLLGWWVIRVASEATTVSKSGLRGQACPPLPGRDRGRDRDRGRIRARARGRIRVRARRSRRPRMASRRPTSTGGAWSSSRAR
jgi:hypothetical protein